MTEGSPARRRQRAAQILRQANTAIDDALTSYRDLVDKHRRMTRTLLSLIPSDLAGLTLPAMTDEGADWTNDAYDEVERICVELFAPVHAQINEAATQLTHEQRQRERIMLQTERVHRSIATVKGKITRKDAEIVASEGRLHVAQAALARREGAFFSFIFKSHKEEEAVAVETRTREKLQGEKLELESMKVELERERDNPAHPANFASAEGRIREIEQRQTDLESQVRHLEERLETILIQPYHKQIQRMRESHDECRNALVTALRRFSVLSTKQADDQSFESWLDECLERRNETSVLIGAETAKLVESLRLKQEKAIESLTKTRQREIAREQAKKDKRRAERERRRKAAERRKAAAARRRITEQQRREDVERQLEAERQRDLERLHAPTRRGRQPQSFQPDLEELRKRLT